MSSCFNVPSFLLPHHLIMFLESSEEDEMFAEYALVGDGPIAKILECLPFEEAATLGIGITTMDQSLYMTMNMPLLEDAPIEGAPLILVYCGISATGTLAIQLAIQYAKL
jgi:NADPH:quinone reductase-like Zn-dependent oxidoreductase